MFWVNPPLPPQLDLGLKDVSLALDVAHKVQAPMPFASILHDRFLGAAARGRGKCLSPSFSHCTFLSHHILSQFATLFLCFLYVIHRFLSFICRKNGLDCHRAQHEGGGGHRPGGDALKRDGGVDERCGRSRVQEEKSRGLQRSRA